MDIFIKIGQLILSLSILVIFHELGHFIPAKIFKTKVEKFYLFFNPWFSLFKKKIKGTIYGIGWLPLGGYVQIAGMAEEVKESEKPKPYHFISKKPWQRFIILIGGVFVNVVLAVLIYSMILFFYGQKYIQNKDVKDGITVSSVLEKELGMKNGDKIVSIDGKPVGNFFTSLEKFIMSNKFTIKRGDESITKNMPEDFLSKFVEGKVKMPYSLRMPFVVDSVLQNSRNIQLKKGDHIIAINDKPIKYIDQIKQELSNYKNENVLAKIKRGEEQIDLELNIDEYGKMGVFPAFLTLNQLENMGVYKITSVDYNIFESFVGGAEMSYKRLKSYVGQLKKVINPNTGAYKGVGGFMSIGNLFPSSWDWLVFWNITAFLSIMLAILNILPIPVLDGGHIMFVVYEMIFARKPNKNVIKYSQIAGLIFLLLLFVFANYNDVIRYILK